MRKANIAIDFALTIPKDYVSCLLRGGVKQSPQPETPDGGNAMNEMLKLLLQKMEELDLVVVREDGELRLIDRYDVEFGDGYEVVDIEELAHEAMRVRLLSGEVS
jgi:hypothetical protein